MGIANVPLRRLKTDPCPTSSLFNEFTTQDTSTTLPADRTAEGPWYSICRSHCYHKSCCTQGITRSGHKRSRRDRLHSSRSISTCCSYKATHRRVASRSRSRTVQQNNSDRTDCCTCPCSCRSAAGRPGYWYTPRCSNYLARPGTARCSSRSFASPFVS